MYNVSWALVYKVNIDDETIFQVLNEINGVAPTNWFIARNVGKDRKEIFAYIVNNAHEYIQLIPLKGDKRNGLIDKGNIITLNKSTDIEKCILIMTDYCKIKLQSKDGTRFLLIAHIVGSTKHQRKSIKALRKEYKKSSRPSQTFWNIFIVIVTVLTVIFGYKFGYWIAQSQLSSEQEANQQVAQTFEQTKAFINSPEYKDLFSLKIQPFESNAVVTGDTKVVEVNSFRFTVDKNAEFKQFDSGDYSYSFGSSNHVLGVGYINTYNREDEVVSKNETVYEKIKDGTLEKMGYSMKSHYDMTRTKYFIDYFSDDINKFNVFEKIIFNYVVSDMISNYDSDRKVLAVYEKEFDSYYMIVEKMQHDEMHENTVYSYGIYIYFKDDLNTVESYSVTCMNHTEEECFAIINSMELIEE